MMLGRIDEVDGNYVATRFVAGVIPLGCVYIAAKGTRGGSADGMPIQTTWRSILAAYGRVWAPVAAVLVLVAGAVRGGLSLAIAGVAAALLLASVLAHRSGRLSEDEKARVRLLGTVTGLRIDPMLLQPAIREAKRASLLGLMDKAGIPSSASSLASLVEDIPVPALPLVYGYARYAGDDPQWRACAEALYRRYEASAL